MVTRPVTAPSHEARVPRYLSAQHYREHRIYKQEEEQEVPAPTQDGRPEQES